MEDWKDGIISVEAEKIIPMTKGEWKEFQKQMRMEGDYFYMVGNKKYVHYDGEDYLRTEDYRQELDKAREEGYQKGWEDGSKGKVFEKIEVETEVTFKDLRDVIEGREEVKDTPEETESDVQEWEEELGKLMSTWGKVLFVNKGRIGAGMQTAMYLKFYHFIKYLLSEREREVLNSMREWVVEYHKDNWDIRDFDAEIAIGKIIDRELSKLSKKK